MLSELSKNNGIKIFLVKRLSETVAGTIILLHRKTGIYGYSASHPSAQNYRPNDFMLFNAIKWLMNGGFEVFDMGSDSPSQKSLLFFKRKWLAKQETIPTYSFGSVSSWLSDSSDNRFTFVRKCFRYLPVRLSRMAGEMTVRYFG